MNFNHKFTLAKIGHPNHLDKLVNDSDKTVRMLANNYLEALKRRRK